MSECPQCASHDIDQTIKFDLTMIDADECQHDFECYECGCLFQILFAPIDTRVIERGIRPGLTESDAA